jgi:hypothetical protein
MENKTDFILEFGRSMLHAHLFNPQSQSQFQNPKCVDSDSCLLTALFFSFSSPARLNTFAYLTQGALRGLSF